MMRRVIVLALATVALAAPVAQASHRDDFEKEPTAVGSGGAAGTRRRARHQGGDRRARARRQRRRRGGRGRRRARRDRAVLVPASAAAASWSSARRRAGSRRSTAARRRPRRCGRTRSSRTARRSPFDDARYSGLSAGVPGTVAQWDEALRPLRHLVAERGCCSRRSTSPAAASWSTRPSSTRPRRTSTYFDDIPSTAAIYLDPDGTPRDVGTTLRNPDLARTYELHRPLRRQARVLPRPDRRGDRRAAQNPPLAPDRRPHLAARPDDRARPARATTRVEREPDPRRLPRPRRLRHGPAVERRLDRRRGAEHPRGLPPRSARDRTQALHRFLEASRYAFADRNAYLGDPDFVDVPLRRPAVGRVRGRAARADRPTRPRTRRSPRRPATAAPAGSVARRRPATAVDDAPHRRRQATATSSSYTFTIESTGGNGDRRARLRASCSTTS